MIYEHLPKWTYNVLDSRVPHDVDSITETIEAVMDALHVGDIIDFSPVLLMSCAPNPTHLAAALRVTFAVRSRTKFWFEARDAAVHWCNKMGYDPEDVLYGMLHLTPDSDEPEVTGIIRELIAGEY